RARAPAVRSRTARGAPPSRRTSTRRRPRRRRRPCRDSARRALGATPAARIPPVWGTSPRCLAGRGLAVGAGGDLAKVPRGRPRDLDAVPRVRAALDLVDAGRAHRVHERDAYIVERGVVVGDDAAAVDDRAATLRVVVVRRDAVV